jgi:hypothetical protein
MALHGKTSEERACLNHVRYAISDLNWAQFSTAGVYQVADNECQLGQEVYEIRFKHAADRRRGFLYDSHFQV